MKYSIRILREYEVDSCPATKQFNFLTIGYFGGCPSTPLTVDEDRSSTEYIGASPPPFATLKVLIQNERTR